MIKADICLSSAEIEQLNNGGTTGRLVAGFGKVPDVQISISSPSSGETRRSKRYREMIQTWLDAYPEDMFIPLPSPNAESDEMKQYRTRASAGMGRHMAKAILRQFDTVDSEMAKEASE